MGKYLNIGIIYIILWIIYYSQGVLYTAGGSISQGILLFQLLVSAYCLIKVHKERINSNFIKSLDLFLLLMTIYGILHILLGKAEVITELTPHIEVRKFIFLKNLYISCAPIYSFYYFTKKGLISTTTLKFAFILLLILAIVSYINTYLNVIERINKKEGDDITNNGAYFFVALIPMLLIWKNRPILVFVLLTVILYFVLMGMKRGAMIIGFGMFVYLLYGIIKLAPPKYKLLVRMLCIIMVIVGLYLAMDIYNNSDYFQRRMEETMEGNSSHRDVFYANLLDFFINKSEGLALVIGNGCDYTISLIGNYAHNDWLEIAINQGLLGIFAYIYYFTSLYKDIKILGKNNETCKKMLAMVFFSMFLTSLFSMSYNGIKLATSLAIGYCLAQLPDKKKIKVISRK